jgi:hypothetical protein
VKCSPVNVNFLALNFPILHCSLSLGTPPANLPMRSADRSPQDEVLSALSVKNEGWHRPACDRGCMKAGDMAPGERSPMVNK